jgi:hypothetical protein
MRIVSWLQVSIHLENGMTQLDNLITSRVSKLVDEANRLSPSSCVAISTMTDKNLLQRSAGAAVVTDNLGNETVYLDPSRATEYMAAHEIMHLILHRSGWPQMYCMIPRNIDPFARRLADGIDNFMDHLTFTPRLEALGFKVVDHQEWFISVLRDWPATKVTGPNILWNALTILEVLFWEEDLRERALEVVSVRQPQSLELARKLQQKANRARGSTKAGVRLAMIEVLDFLEDWITEESGNTQKLRRRIGISPLFTKSQLQRSASRTIELESYPFMLNRRQLWLGSLMLKSDSTRFRNYTCVDTASEPPEIDGIRQKIETLTLEAFITVENIKKYGTFS